MFQFPRCPLRDCSQSARPCAGRVAPFGHPRIAGCQRLPGAFRRVAASFLGRQRQGIHHAPIMRISCVRSPPGAVVTTPADRLAPAGRFRLAAAPLCCRTPALPRWVVVCVCVFLYCSVCVFDGTLQCARASRHEPPHLTSLPVWGRTRVTMSRRGVRRTLSGHRRLPRPQNPAGSAWRIVKVPEDPTVVLTTHRSSCLRGRQTSSEAVLRPRTRSPNPYAVFLTAAGVTKGGSPRYLHGNLHLGGAAGTRTPDLRRARAALSQLSYGPRQQRPGAPGSPPPRSSLNDRTGWARLDSNQGPRPYQGRALTA